MARAQLIDAIREGLGGPGALLRRAERAPGPQRRGVLSRHVRLAHLELEPARRPHDRDAGGHCSWLTRRDGYARIVVWAHNSHLGDARFTQMGEEGELKVGQLVRERHGTDALLVGFTT